jgi:hypothetical protein
MDCHLKNLLTDVLFMVFCIHGGLVKAKELVSEMMNKGMMCPDIVFFSSIINRLCKEEG